VTAVAPAVGAALVDSILARWDPTADDDYDPDVARLLAVASMWAYSDAPTLAGMLWREGFPVGACELLSVRNEVIFLDAQAFFVRSACGRVGLLCFRGTEPTNVLDWLTDISYEPEVVEGVGRIHGGFYRSVEALWPAIGAELRVAFDGPTGIAPLEALYFAGHSLGGALAAVAAALLCQRDECVRARAALRGVYTYGQPMIGSVDVAQRCDGLFGHVVFRHVYGCDVVPRLPARTAGRFAHFGRELHDVDGRWAWSDRVSTQVCSATGAVGIGVLAWVKAQLPLARGVRMPYSLDDHSPRHYVRVSRAAPARVQAGPG
jgi:hypothetical protein